MWISSSFRYKFNRFCILGVAAVEECETFSRGHHRQAMHKRIRNDPKRYHTAGVVDEIMVRINNIK